jgi:hypothetical protein
MGGEQEKNLPKKKSAKKSENWKIVGGKGGEQEKNLPGGRATGASAYVSIRQRMCLVSDKDANAQVL